MLYGFFCLTIYLQNPAFGNAQIRELTPIFNEKSVEVSPSQLCRRKLTCPSCGIFGMASLHRPKMALSKSMFYRGLVGLRWMLLGLQVIVAVRSIPIS
jgi:hypothetical protein